MKYDVITIGDSMKDTFIFPSLEETKKPIDGSLISQKDKNLKYLTFALGDKISITESFEDIGGTACNVAVGLSRLKIKTALISSIGKDETGEKIIEKLKKEKIDVNYLKSYLTRKTSFSIILSYKGERTIFVKQNFEPDDFTIPANLDTEWLYVGALGRDYQKLYAKITGLATEKSIKIALNPGTIQVHDGLHGFGALLSIANIIFLNREEAQQLLGISSLTTVKELAMNLRKTGVKIVVITDGDGGAYVSFEDEFMKVGALPVTCVESTGAGDGFAAGFLAGYIKKENMLTCLKWGAINGSSVVTKYGAQQGLLTDKALEKKYKEYRFPADGLRFS